MNNLKGEHISINNTRVNNFGDALIVSGFPMKTNIDCNLIDKANKVFTQENINKLTEEELLDMFSDKEKKEVETRLKRMGILGSAKPGSGHDCALKGIHVNMTLTAPQYFWLQFERYHFQDTISSQSSMHRISKMDIKEQCNKYVLPSTIKQLENLIDDYNHFEERCETLKVSYGEDICKKKMFQYVVSNVPEGLLLSRSVQMNYLQLKTIYQQRKGHKLEEWSEFCTWITTLPFSQLITNKGGVKHGE